MGKVTASQCIGRGLFAAKVWLHLVFDVFKHLFLDRQYSRQNKSLKSKPVFHPLPSAHRWNQGNFIAGREYLGLMGIACIHRQQTGRKGLKAGKTYEQNFFQRFRVAVIRQFQFEGSGAAYFTGNTEGKDMYLHERVED
jgi:hypothetical protein